MAKSKKNKSLEAKEKLGVTRSKLLFDYPFWGTIVLKLRPKEMSEQEIKMLKAQGLPCTAATDGRFLFYNPDFICDCSIQKLIAVCGHEGAHCIHLHHTRKQGRDHVIWNCACDMAINWLLKNGKVGEMGKDWLFNLSDIGGKDVPDIENKNAEEIYNLIVKQIKKNSQVGKGKTKGGLGAAGVVMDSNSGGTKETKEEQETFWKEAVVDAAIRAKAVGKLPANLERWVDDWIQPKIDWKYYLSNWFFERIKDSYSWLKRNRRIPNIYMPDRDGKTLGRIVICIDTSGSIDNEMLRRFLGAIEELRGVFNCSVDMLSVDAAVADYKHFQDNESIRAYKPKGGGGTRFDVAFQYVEETLKIKPNGLIYFTDLYCSDYPDETPDYPVLFVTWTQEPGEIPFGKVVIVNDIKEI